MGKIFQHLGIWKIQEGPPPKKMFGFRLDTAMLIRYNGPMLGNHKKQVSIYYLYFYKK